MNITIEFNWGIRSIWGTTNSFRFTWLVDADNDNDLETRTSYGLCFNSIMHNYYLVIFQIFKYFLVNFFFLFIAFSLPSTLPCFLLCFVAYLFNCVRMWIINFGWTQVPFFCCFAYAITLRLCLCCCFNHADNYHFMSTLDTPWHAKNWDNNNIIVIFCSLFPFKIIAFHM